MNKGKPYPMIEEEDSGTQTMNEPAIAAVYAKPYTPVEHRPISGLPKNWDELLDCIKEGEEELERGEYIPWDVAAKNMRNHIAEYVA